MQMITFVKFCQEIRNQHFWKGCEPVFALNKIIWQLTAKNKNTNNSKYEINFVHRIKFQFILRTVIASVVVVVASVSLVTNGFQVNSACPSHCVLS